MPCCHPVKAFDTGLLTENGKKELVRCPGFTGDFISVDKIPKYDLSKAPHVNLNGRLYLTSYVTQPCGYCVGCRMDKAKQWKHRNVLELAYHSAASFITITYDDEHLPNVDGEMVLNKEDFQLFLKRLRKYIGPFRYFGCGEYGEQGLRPHGHFIIYGVWLGDKSVGINRWHSSILAKCWPFGFHEVQMVTPGSIAYVSGYVEKKQLDPNWFSYSVKPFLMSSRRPGIGMQYVVDHAESIKSTGKIYGAFSETNKKFTSAKIPASMLRKFDGQEWLDAFKEAQQAAGKSMEELNKIVYKDTDAERIGFFRGDCLEHELLERRRKL